MGRPDTGQLRGLPKGLVDESLVAALAEAAKRLRARAQEAARGPTLQKGAQYGRTGRTRYGGGGGERYPNEAGREPPLSRR